MSVTARLVFDPTSPDSSHNVGSFVRAGDDGTLIGHVSDALKVSIANASVSVTQGTSPWVIGDGGGSLTVDASDLDIRDLSQATDSISSWTKDGSGNAINSTSNALNVYITGSGALTVNDPALANTAIENTATAVSTTAVNVVSSALANRKWMYLANLGNKGLFFGKTGVTASNGFPLFPGQQSEFKIGPAVAPQIIGETGASSEDLRVMELS